MLRIISGIYGGRKIEKPNLKITRPTKDRIKESVFSMIHFKIPNSIFLDLFSGSGSIAIESISRGAMKTVAIEKNPDAFKIIKKNIDKLKISNIELIQNDAIFFLERAKGKKFDFIYIDPPFNSNLYNKSLELIDNNDLLSEKGYIIVETNDCNLIKIPKKYLILKKKKYGKNYIFLISNNL